MPAFGVSAFLRIVHMNARPQRTELRRRSVPREGGYDFHNSLRRLAGLLLLDDQPLESVLAATAEIAQQPERRSAQVGLSRLDAWRIANPGPILLFEPIRILSPGGTFSVTFTPNFGLQIAERSVAVHLWNTAAPRLEPRLVRAVLSLFAAAYRDAENSPDDLAVLCLKTMRLIRLGNAEDVAELGQLIVAHVDTVFDEIKREIGEPLSAPSDRPPTPPPAE